MCAVWGIDFVIAHASETSSILHQSRRCQHEGRSLPSPRLGWSVGWPAKAQGAYRYREGRFHQSRRPLLLGNHW